MNKLTTSSHPPRPRGGRRAVALTFLVSIIALIQLFHCLEPISALQPNGRLSRRLAAITRFYKRLEDHEYSPNNTGDDPSSKSPSRSESFAGEQSLLEQLAKRELKSSSSVKSPLWYQSTDMSSTSSTSPSDDSVKRTAFSRRLKTKKQEPVRQVSTVQELRNAVLDERRPLKQVEVTQQFQDLQVSDVLNHEVLKIIAERFHSGSTPGNRSDNATVALSMEGGGMRGCVSAGMAAAIASLGLCDAFDNVYGSSAGSVIGSYMISRQMCMDVYVDVLPAAKKKFVCKQRLVRSLAVSMVDLLVDSLNNSSSNAERTKFVTRQNPGMNISFVLDGILSEDHGLRPLDFETFKHNIEKQGLRVAASCVKNGTMFSKCFGSEDFFGEHATQRSDKTRSGLFACLEASMTVPGATGAPVEMMENDEGVPYFDAFCFEPLPYRSAVEEGATHVLVLCSRPEGFVPTTKPGVYEQGVAPLYFQTHKLPQVADFFQKGGQQYIYAEDLLTLEEGKFSPDGVLIPPPRILYGVERDDTVMDLITARESTWKRAHILPFKVSRSTPELPTLEQDKDAVLEAVRSGFSAAYDLLVPAIGLDLALNGEEVAKLVFPRVTGDDSSGEKKIAKKILQTKVRVTGHTINDVAEQEGQSLDIPQLPVEVQELLSKHPYDISVPPPSGTAQSSSIDDSNIDASTLLRTLPGFKEGKLGHLALGLRLETERRERGEYQSR